MASCPECRSEFKPHRYDQAYCCAGCGTKARTRELARGAALYRALYWWRLDRASATENLRFICREIKAWIEDDKATGRGPPPKHRHDVDRGHQRRKTG